MRISLLALSYNRPRSVLGVRQHTTHSLIRRVHLVYIDEIKYDPPEENFYWLVALAIPEHCVRSVDAALNDIAVSFFGSSAPDVSSEFHATAIVQGKAACKGRKLDDRIRLFQQLADVVDAHPDVGRIVIRLEPALMTRTDVHSIAFMYLVERVEELMATRNSVALLIADHDRETVWPNVRSLAGYRNTGTDWAYGREIKRIVDTVHHTDSTHSRLLQLTDIYAYAMSLREKAPAKHPRSTIVTYVNKLSNFSWPTKFKFWPPHTT